MKLGILFNGLVATALTVPIVAFLLSSVTHGRQVLTYPGCLSSRQRISAGETRLATFTNPYVTPTDGKTVDTACWVAARRRRQFQVFAINCAHLGCPWRWFPQSGLFIAPATAALITVTVRARRARRKRAVRVSVQGAGRYVTIQAGELPTPGSQPPLFSGTSAVRCTERVGFHREQVVRLQRNECFAQERQRHGRDRTNRANGLIVAATCGSDSRSCRTSRTTKYR